MATSAVPASKYKPKSFDRKKYTVENYQYPSDLMGLTSEGNGVPQSPYGGNCAIFYINVNNESRMIQNSKNDPNSQFVDVDASERIKKGLAGREYTKYEVSAVNATLNLGGAAASKWLGVGGIGGAAAAANIIGTQAIMSNADDTKLTENSKFSRPQKRLKTVIALHVPNQLSIRYGAGWSDEETFGFQAFMEGGKALARAFEEGGKKALMDTVKDTTKQISSSVANAALQKGGASSAMSALTGLAPNPMKEQVFKGVDFRTFTMEYQFAPRNMAESNNVHEIIKAFKYHMHPEYKDANNFLFLYPSEFDIEYYSNGNENLNIHRHTSCVLTELNVNYTPNGNFSTFKDGIPTQINVSMSFKELTILTKELIQEGL